MVASTSLVALLAIIGGAAAMPLETRNNTGAGSGSVSGSKNASDPTSMRNALDLSQYQPVTQISLGPRPYYLVDNMKDGPLKKKLQECYNKPMQSTTFSLAHRGGGTLQFPEHTLESNMAGVRMGAGVLECDVSFTSDRELVCRHSNCDLHTTTNIVTIPELNAKCTQPFKPANGTTKASAQCCTSDITLAEFKSLCGKMDSSNASATTPEAYLGGVLDWRTTEYNQCGTLMSLKEHIEFTDRMGLEFTPELKTPVIPMPFQGDYTQEKYAQQMVDTFKEAGIDMSRVWGQSFLYDDVLYWLKNEPEFAKQVMYLDETADAPNATIKGAADNLAKYKKDGVNYVSPPLNYLLEAPNGEIVPSYYAKKAKEVGMGVITWSLERSGPQARAAKAADYYVSTYAKGLTRDGDLYTVVDVLAQQVGVCKMFSDWSATTSYYANCMGIGLKQ